MPSRFQNMRTLVATATYNERDNIELLLSDIFALDDQIEALVIDDASPDGTGALLDQLAASEPRLHVVHRHAKLGLGSAHQLAFAYAIQHDFGRLITMDADISHNPSSIPALLKALEDADMVIGSRYVKGGSSDYSGYRKFVSVCANTLARILLGIPLHEFTTSFRAFDVDMLRRYRCSKLRSNGYSFFTETIFRLESAGFRLAEVPIHFKDRHEGVSKLPSAEVFRGVAKLFRLAVSRATGRNVFHAATEIDDKCVHCTSPFLIEIFSKQDETAQPVTDNDGSRAAAAYSCSSVERRAKPQVVQCLNCGLIHIPKKLVPQDIGSLYGDVEDTNYLADISARRAGFRETYRRILKHIGATGRLLEIGAYCGLFLAEAEAGGWQCEGIEPSRWATNKAKENTAAPVHVGTLAENRDKLEPGFDAIVAWDVLEHVKQPFEMLEDVGRLIRPGGVFCFSTLDIDNWFPRLLGKRWPWIMDMHLHYFSGSLLRRWLDHAGYDLIEVLPYRHYASARYAWTKGADIFPPVFARALKVVAPVIPAGLVLPFSFGDIKLFVARRRTE
ncbi:MAG: glycosyltransferase [Rhodospirillaceae bacterium]|jgi:SAM-dependent methyltransferase|nr:glycosyltransferase [Rhodospirillaceae bacterium]